MTTRLVQCVPPGRFLSLPPALLTLWVACSLSALAPPASANGGAARAGAGEDVSRPHELRTLLTSHEFDQRKVESRRLDPQERQLLRREIREATRGAYADPPAGGRGGSSIKRLPQR